MKERERLRGFYRRAAERCVAILLAFVVVSCSGGVPSESDARDAFASQYQEKIDQGLVRIDSFSKVNAQQGEMFGVKFYNVEYRATISWPKGLNTQCLGKNDDIFREPNCFRAEPRSVGQVENLNGGLAFQKTEKGWRGPNHKVY